MTSPRLTLEEREAVHALYTLLRKWPKTLTLFARAGKLVILKPGRGRTYDEAEVTRIPGVACDGGDPHGWDVA